MPLSDEERTQLEALEQELDAQYPRLARKLLSGSAHPALTRRTFLSALISLAGLLLLLVGIGLNLVVLGAGGFVLMIAGGYWQLGRRHISTGGVNYTDERREGIQPLPAVHRCVGSGNSLLGGSLHPVYWGSSGDRGAAGLLAPV